MEKKETVILYRGQIESLLNLSSLKDVKAVLRAIVSYSMDGVDPEIPEHLTFGWMWFKHTIDQNNASYAEMVNKRKDAANKRWGNDANDASACKSMQVHANDASACKTCYNENDNDNYYSLSPACAWVREYADDILSIANAYPKAKVGDFIELQRLIIAAIGRESDKPGMDVSKAVSKVRDGVTAYAAAMTGKSKMFIAKPEDFFGKGQYNFDPEVWKLEESTPAGKTAQRKYNPADPSTWKPRTNNNEG